MAQNKRPATRAQVRVEKEARRLIVTLTKLDADTRKKLLNGIHECMPGRTLHTLESGSPDDCKEYVISLMRVYGGAQFLHALVAFDRKFSAFLKQYAGINALARACLQVKE